MKVRFFKFYLISIINAYIIQTKCSFMFVDVQLKLIFCRDFRKVCLVVHTMYGQLKHLSVFIRSQDRTDPKKTKTKKAKLDKSGGPPTLTPVTPHPPASVNAVNKGKSVKEYLSAGGGSSPPPSPGPVQEPGKEGINTCVYS